MIEVNKSKRVFMLSGIKLADIDETKSPEEIKQFYQAMYPELATAVIGEPNYVGNEVRYTFQKSVGVKG